MFFTINTQQGRTFTVNSTSADLSAFRAEVAAATTGFITADGKTLLMKGVIDNSVITLAPYPPNTAVLL